MPTFNAQTLFAFGNDAISNAFADNSRGMYNQDKPHEVKNASNPWNMATPDLIQEKSRPMDAVKNQNGSIEDQLNFHPSE